MSVVLINDSEQTLTVLLSSSVSHALLPNARCIVAAWGASEGPVEVEIDTNMVIFRAGSRLSVLEEGAEESNE